MERLEESDISPGLSSTERPDETGHIVNQQRESKSKILKGDIAANDICATFTDCELALSLCNKGEHEDCFSAPQLEVLILI